MSFLNFQLPFFATIALAAIIPLIVGSVWYNPAVFGKAWMTSVGKTQDELRAGSNMALIFGLTYVFSFFIAFSLNPIVIHQFGFFSMIADKASETQMMDPNSQLHATIADMMHRYGTHFRTFRHGALHGTLTGLFLITPILGVNALFERRGFKYIAINGGFWIVCCALMGAFVCHFQTLPFHM